MFSTRVQKNKKPLNIFIVSISMVLKKTVLYQGGGEVLEQGGTTTIKINTKKT